MTIIFEKPNVIVVSHNPDKNYILFDWTNFGVSLEEIKALHTAALDVAKRLGCHDYVAETSKVTNTLRQDVVAWFGDTWLPVLTKFGLRNIVTVVPKGAIATLSTKSWQRQIVGGINVINVASLADAEAALTSSQARGG